QARAVVSPGPVGDRGEDALVGAGQRVAGLIDAVYPEGLLPFQIGRLDLEGATVAHAPDHSTFRPGGSPLEVGQALQADPAEGPPIPASAVDGVRIGFGVRGVVEVGRPLDPE